MAVAEMPRRKLVMLFVWLLTGSLGYCVMNSAVPTLLPLTLRKLEASNFVIGLFVGSLPSLINMLVNPVVSFKSDRTRTCWGRRRPYILAATPTIAILLILIGWSGHIMRALGVPEAYFTVVTVSFLGAVVLLYQIFYMLVGSTIYYLFVDVVPARCLGRYMAFFNMVGALKGFLFHNYFFKYAENDAPWLYTGIALVYFTLLMVMLLKVKEGEYPPVTEGGRRTGVLECARIYIRECFSIPFYIWLFVATGINSASIVCRANFGTFFALENLSLSYAQYGRVTGYSAAVGVLLALPLGWLNDRIHPLKIFTAGGVLVVVINAFSFFQITDYTTYFFWTILLQAAYTIQFSSSLPLSAALFPKSHYGQFGSAQAMFVSIILIGANSIGGVFMDRVGDYRYLYVWDFALTTVAVGALMVVFALWGKYGGEKNYVAPLRTAAS